MLGRPREFGDGAGQPLGLLQSLWCQGLCWRRADGAGGWGWSRGRGLGLEPEPGETESSPEAFSVGLLPALC